VGDSLVGEVIPAGTTIYGLFSSITITSGNAILQLAGYSRISDLVNSYYNTAAQYGYYSEAQKCTSERLNPYLAGGLYDKASWLLIPSQVEEDFVRTFKPTDNSGSLSFTRASDATRTNSAGEIERTPWNFFQDSEMFSTANWAKINSSVSANTTTAPNGTLTADTLVENTANSTHIAIQTTAGQISGNTYTASIYAKASGRSWIGLFNNAGGTGNAFFDLSNGTVGTVLTGSAQIQSVGNGWYRCSITFVPTTTGTFNIQVRIASADNVPTYTGNGTSGIFIWGAQLVEGTDSKPYFPTTNRLDVPRLDYRNADGTVNSCPRLLLEPQRTNSIRNSTMVGAVAGSPGTIPTNWKVLAGSGLTRTVVGIGTENGLSYIDLRYSGTASGTSELLGFEQDTQIAASNGQSWSLSSYVKIISGTANSFSLNWSERDSSAGFLVGAAVTISPTSTLQRFTLSGTLTGGATVAAVQPFIRAVVTIGTAYDFTIRIAAPQMELGAYATTFIPTTTAAVTRILDGFTRTNIFTNNFITAAGGTWFVDLSNNTSLIRDSFNNGLFVSDLPNSLNNSISFGHVATGTSLRLSIRKTISTTNTIIYATLTDTAKVAIKWNGTSIDVFANGVKVVTASAFTTTNMNFLGCFAGDVPKFINQSALFPAPLTDEECITITTL
jgi:hypothetical protein